MTKRLLRNAYITVGILTACLMMFFCWVDAAYLIPANEVGTTLSNDFVYGTDAVIQISSLTDFPTGGGVVRMDDGTHWCLVKYGSVDAGTVELRTLTTPVADYESTAAHTFAAGVEVWLVCAADYITQFVTALPDTTTDHGIVRFDGAIGKMQNSGATLDDSDNLTIGSVFTMIERSSDPAAPAEGTFVIWMSDGTGKGDDGDVLIAGTAGGVTKYDILWDHSAGTPW